MPIDRLDFGNLAESDLAELLAAQVPEGLSTEYKRDLYGNSEADKKELLKDVAGPGEPREEGTKGDIDTCCP